MMKEETKVLLADNRIWLLFIAALLITFNWHFINYSSTYLLFWCAALSIAWKRKNELCLESNLLATSAGLILITWLLFRGTVSEFQSDVITRIYPLVSITGICLLATKPSKIMQYWREIIIVGMTGVPWEHIFSLIPTVNTIAILDAKISRIMLWYVGFDVQRTGDLVILPEGAIQIAGACSSFDLLGLMWQSCIVICFYFTVARNKKLLLLLCSTAIAFGVNGIRLCLMAVLVAAKNDEAFHYWHGDAGAEIFTTAAILLLASVYWFLIERNKNYSDIKSINS